MKFVGTKVHHLSSDTSNHIPLWIVLDGLELPYTVKPFWFEEMWLSDLSCPEIAEVVWSSRCTDDPSVEVMKKIFKLGKDLSKWNRDHFGEFLKGVRKKKRVSLKKKQWELGSISEYGLWNRRSMTWLIKRTGCDSSGLRSYGQQMGTRIPNFFTVEPRNRNEKIQS